MAYPGATFLRWRALAHGSAGVAGQYLPRKDAVPSEPAFFKLCRAQVKHHLVLMHYVVVGIDRSRRTDNPEWRPEPAQPAEGNSPFFRPPLLCIRKYTG